MIINPASIKPIFTKFNSESINMLSYAIIVQFSNIYAVKQQICIFMN